MLQTTASDQKYPISQLLGVDVLHNVLHRFQSASGLTLWVTEQDKQLIVASSTTYDASLYFQFVVQIDDCLPIFLHLDGRPFQEVELALPLSIPAVVNTVREGIFDVLKVMVEKELLASNQSLDDINVIQLKSPLHLRTILDASPMPMGWSNVETDEIEYINPAFKSLFGYKLADIPNLQQWFVKAFPDQVYRQEALSLWREQTLKKESNTGELQQQPLDVTCKDGSVRNVLISTTSVGNKCLVNYSDMTNYWQIQNRLSAHREMLEMIAKGQPLTSILEKIVFQVQSESKGSICSVLLLDEQHKLRSGAAPDLPDFYTKAIDGLKIGPSVGSCGTASYLKERVIVANISEHQYWQGFEQLAARANLAACWSDPILSSSGEVLGTFAIYHTYPTQPTHNDIDLISFASNLASVAIENRQSRDELERKAYYDDLTGLANRRYFFEYANKVLNSLHNSYGYYSMIMLDIDYFKHVNDQYGHEIGDLVLIEVAQAMIKTLDNTGLVGRIGGEEFAVILPHIGKQEAFEIAESLRAAVSELAITSSNQGHVKVTISAGLAQCCDDKEDAIGIDQLFKRADTALYQAKTAGRNRVMVFNMI
ncbi:diguanylate cyclase [Marinomonas atlantica]|uniref:diguanylate cyclase n=1 Tax=Marinomonas atlantica TaxID=1806668 RepID=UPI0009ED727A|nr:diguanylate cyclase [Marinomonas atlantica]